MLHKLFAMALLGVSCTLVAYAEDEKKPGDAKPGFGGKFGAKIDKGKMFDRLDANGDGKVTKEEYVKSMETMMDRLKEKLPAAKGPIGGGDFAAKRFESMDADKDGTVTKEEFEKASIGPFGGGGLGKFKGKGPFKKPEPKD